MLPLCPVLLADAHVCLLPLADDHDCPHRESGPAPGEPAGMVAELRLEVADARQVASILASALRSLSGDRGVEAVLRREQSWWLVPGEPPGPQM